MPNMPQNAQNRPLWAVAPRDGRNYGTVLENALRVQGGVSQRRERLKARGAW